jgi:cytochrome c oxidase subunit 2
MNLFRFLTIMPALMLCVDAHADGDAELGAKVYAICAGCHGSQGQGDALVHAPKLSGQEDWYLERQLRNFRRGVRGSAEHDTHGRSMALMAMVLKTEADISNVIAFISTLPDKPAAPVIQGDVSKGSTCHGSAGEGNVVLNAPALAGMSDWYQLSQLANYKKGLRGTHPDDIYGQQMAPMVAILPDEQAMNDVVAYISSLQ